MAAKLSKTIEIRQVHDLADAEIQSLVAKSDDYLSALYPPESNHAEPLEGLITKNSTFFAAYVDGQLAACGAVKVIDGETKYGEIKRVFVEPQQRGRRLASTLMEHLENHLRGIDVGVVRLEAGPRQPEALQLYRKLGYAERGPFGAYTHDPLSVFMEKTLSAGRD